MLRGNCNQLEWHCILWFVVLRRLLERFIPFFYSEEKTYTCLYPLRRERKTTRGAMAVTARMSLYQWFCSNILHGIVYWQLLEFIVAHEWFWLVDILKKSNFLRTSAEKMRNRSSLNYERCWLESQINYLNNVYQLFFFFLTYLLSSRF